MANVVKFYLRSLAPPLLYALRNKVFREELQWHGNFSSWEEAQRSSDGYAADTILEKVKESSLKVKNGEAAYERDSVLFDTVQYSWPLAAALLLIAVKRHGRLDVLDFGGSLGTTYFQNKKLLDQLDEITWNIVEQKHFVECGKKHFEDSHVRFYYSVEECLAEKSVDVLLCSCVLPCIENPFQFLKSICDKNIEYIIIDRTGFVNNRKGRMTILKVPQSIYKASFPFQFFNEANFLSIFKDNYDLIYDFNCYSDSIIAFDAKTTAKFKGYFFQLKPA